MNVPFLLKVHCQNGGDSDYHAEGIPQASQKKKRGWWNFSLHTNDGAQQSQGNKKRALF